MIKLFNCLQAFRASETPLVKKLIKYYLYAFLTLFFTAQGVEINDISNLNKTCVERIVHPTTVQELIQLVNTAKKDGLKISMAGKRHSQGGHAFYRGNVVIDINKLNKIIHFDPANKLITVEPGVTWKQIQLYCNPYNLALKVTQTASIFTVGGSLSVNCHGRDPHYGPLIETIKSFRILLADGSIVNASREENQELFSLAIGGYGLFGIITEIDISLTQNDIYKKNSKTVSIKDYPAFVKKNIINNPKVGLHYGQIVLFGEKIVTTTYTKTKQHNKKALCIEKEQDVLFTKAALAMRRKYRTINALSRFFEWPSAALRESNSQITCRNNAMQHPVECLEYTPKKNTDLLQSYFIPVNTLPDFIQRFKKLINNKKITLLNVLIRYIPKDTQSFLRYATQDYFEIVLFINIKRSPECVAFTQKWTQKLIAIILDLKGCYYLPTQLFATDTQLKQAYPMIEAFFAKKREYDPQELFVNTFYKRYATNKDPV
jgi:decaprenylphospho-beta-D-ribofuranose 2-oxidase